MRLIFVLIIPICLSLNLTANDGSFYASGATLIPLQETTIELRKEILTLKRLPSGWLKVDILFEFYNPGDAKSLTVGFVTPPASGDVEEEGGHPEIEVFQVMFENELLTYKTIRLADSDFMLNGFNKDEFWSDYVYHFDIPFKQGVNTIRHSYTYRGGSSVDLAESYAYQITTGKRWANKEIGEFQLEIDMGNEFFFIQDSFLETKEPADWKINGIGKIQEKSFELFAGELKVRHVRTTTGILHFSAYHFKPDCDIFFGKIQPYFQAHYWVDDQIVADKLDRINTAISTMPDSLAIAELSDHELRIARNFSYAWHGYIFKDKELNSLFRSCAWYIPDPIITIEKINLSPAEKQSFDWILAEEKRRK
jgi:hypothetical protein